MSNLHATLDPTAPYSSILPSGDFSIFACVYECNALVAWMYSREHVLCDADVRTICMLTALLEKSEKGSECVCLTVCLMKAGIPSPSAAYKNKHSQTSGPV